MTRPRNENRLDLLVVGAGPTALAIGAAARKAGLEVLLVDRGGLCGSLRRFPYDMEFFTTRDLLEIAGVPFSCPDAKPDRRQALVYYQGVARRYGLEVSTVDVTRVDRHEDGGFVVAGEHRGNAICWRASAVALATGYFEQPEHLGVPGEELRWVSSRYFEPYGHYDEHVLIVGGGNTAAETALDLWRNGVRVTLVVRKAALKPTVKYWVKPDLENRIAEGSIEAHFETVVRELRESSDGRRSALLQPVHGGATRELEIDAAYVLIGYLPDVALERRCGIEVDDETLVPSFDVETCESSVSGVYVAGTLQAGRDTGRIFIENSRDHGERIVAHILASRRVS